MHAKIVQYFKECYQADNREQSLWDIYSKNNEFLKVNSTEEANRLHEGGRISIDPEHGNQLEAAIATYRREKTFLYCSHFLIGKAPISQGLGKKAKTICAPLLFFDVSLSKEGSSYELLLDTASARWNSSLLSLLSDDRDAIFELEHSLEQENYTAPAWIGAWLEKHCNNLIELDIVDSLSDVSLLDSIRRKRFKGFKLVSAGATLLVKRSLSSRGIIDELSLISEESSVSVPLEQLFFNKVKSKNKSSYKKACLDNVPGILSSTQSDALKNAAIKDLSLVIGPPGTGKSYTIACMVLERFMQGESVLVVSENEFAVDVIQEKLVEKLGLSSNAILRAGAKDYHKYLKQYIGNLTKGIGLDKPGESQRKKLLSVKREIHKYEKQFISISNAAVSDGIFLDGLINSGRKASFIDRYKVWRQRNRLKKYGLLYDLLEKVKQNQKARESTLAKQINHIYLQALHKVLNRHRKELTRLNSALRARTSLRQETLFSGIDYSILLQALPIWLCSFSSLHKALPLKKELFDLVIIDEATQCNIAACIPALYRAKRAVVVGDPKQLRHVSFLSGRKQEVIQNKIGLVNEEIDLNYRDKSMIDFTDYSLASQSSVVMLDEHYRSAPEIIDFSNRMFYDNGLRIMTEKPVLHSELSVEVIQIPGASRIDGVNQQEAEAIIEKLQNLIDDQKKIPDEYKLSIGVLSFFRDQAEKLQQLIFEQFDLTVITQHKLRAGTPYAFQGEERDIMLISCAVDQSSSGGTYNYLNRPDMFNVSVTRARDLQLVFLSTDISKIPNNNLLRLFVDSIKKRPAFNNTNMLARDKNIESLSNALHEQGMKVMRDYPIAGISMDLVVMSESHTLAIDLIGFPGEHEDVLHLDRYKIFERAGLQIFPLSYTGWVYAKETVIKKIKSSFHTLNTQPVSRLSVQQVSSHWSKLLAVNPELAKTVRALEFDLVDIKQEIGVKQLGNIIDRYHKLIWVLNQKLDPNELTYSRYMTSAERVFLGGIENLKKVVILTKSVSGDEFTSETSEAVEKQKALREDQALAIETLLSNNVSAIVSLEEVALKWSKLGVDREDFDDYLKELERLGQRIEQYAVN